MFVSFAFHLCAGVPQLNVSLHNATERERIVVNEPLPILAQPLPETKDTFLQRVSGGWDQDIAGFTAPYITAVYGNDGSRWGGSPGFEANADDVKGVFAGEKTEIKLANSDYKLTGKLGDFRNLVWLNPYLTAGGGLIAQTAKCYIVGVWSQDNKDPRGIPQNERDLEKKITDLKSYLEGLEH